jgi:predicted nucleic-acid-binding protein
VVVVLIKSSLNAKVLCITTYTVTYANNYIDKLTTVNGTEQGIAKPIEFDKSAITATDRV